MLSTAGADGNILLLMFGHNIVSKVTIVVRWAGLCIMNLISTEADGNVNGCAGIWSQTQVLEGYWNHCEGHTATWSQCTLFQFKIPHCAAWGEHQRPTKFNVSNWWYSSMDYNSGSSHAVICICIHRQVWLTQKYGMRWVYGSDILSHPWFKCVLKEMPLCACTCPS